MATNREPKHEIAINDSRRELLRPLRLVRQLVKQRGSHAVLLVREQRLPDPLLSLDLVFR